MIQRKIVSGFAAGALMISSIPVSAGAAASGTLTLPAAIDTAAQNSPELKKAELTADSAGWGKLEALSDHLPQLYVRGTHVVGAQYATLGVVFGGNAVHIPTAYPQTNFDIDASILLFDGLGAINRYRAALYESEAADLELSYNRFKVEERIGIRFQQALAAQELVKVADQNIETLEQHLKLAQASHRAGFSTNVDVLRIEALLEEARAERILATDNVAIAKHALNQAMGIESDERSLEGKLPLPDTRKVPANLAFDVSKREDLDAQTRREKAQDRMSAASNGAFFPRISFFGAEQVYKYGAFDPAVLPNDTFQSAYSLGFRVTWSLFDGGATLAKSHRAEDRAKIDAEHTRELLIASPNDFDVWKRKYIYNSALYAARKRAEAKSAESVRLATLAVRAGTKTHAEALDAEQELFRARAGVIRAQVDAAEALANLELALGHRL